MAGTRVVVAMSGGVDSSVAAALLREAGYDVVGVSMLLASRPAASVRAGQGCCSLEDFRDARRVAARLGIPYYVWNLARRVSHPGDGRLHRRVPARTDAESVRALQPGPQVRRAVATSGRPRRRADRHRSLCPRAHRRRRADPPAARPGHRKGPELLPLRLDAAQLARTHFPLGDAHQARGAGNRSSTGTHGRRQAGEPGDLLRAEPRLRDLRRA